jgi:putative radical SAM enzyme (TIGR03279 family)
MKKGLISYVEPGSAAYEGGILPGDCLIKVNGHKIRDIFDYRYYTTEENISLELIDAEGESYIVDIEKDADEDPGIAFAEPMIDADRGCVNNCIFCFIDQMPPGMRDTLYFKDDDTRLSFLTGNYVTLTNIGYAELNRLVKYRLSPINVSVHTTNPELRCSMLKHKGAGDVLKKIDVLRKGCITVNAQIVLCPGYNDGKELERTLSDLLSFSDCVASVSIVPVGLTKYREGLTKLRLPTKEEAEAVIDTAEKFRKLAIERTERDLFILLMSFLFMPEGIFLITRFTTSFRSLKTAWVCLDSLIFRCVNIYRLIRNGF